MYIYSVRRKKIHSKDFTPSELAMSIIKVIIKNAFLMACKMGGGGYSTKWRNNLFLTNNEILKSFKLFVKTIVLKKK